MEAQNILNVYFDYGTHREKIASFLEEEYYQVSSYGLERLALKYDAELVEAWEEA